jgi:hypothetical protein
MAGDLLGKQLCSGEKTLVRNLKKSTDEILFQALEKAYASRSRLFYKKIHSKNIDKLISKIKAIDSSSFSWDFEEFNISKEALDKIGTLNISTHEIFCHPNILITHPELIDYYRNIAALSQKGLSQLLSGRGLAPNEKPLAISKIINGILSQVITHEKSFSKQSASEVLFAELGSEIQGTWVNIIGSGAAKQVEHIIIDFAKQKKLIKSIQTASVEIAGKKRKQKVIRLTNNWEIIFSSEPDVAIRDTEKVLQVAIEIKGSMDKAGAQTRYGEAKKSFGKALSENPRCETIYLASCFTKSVLDQIKQDGQVRNTYNLIDILQDERKKNQFLEEIFRYQIRIVY